MADDVGGAGVDTAAVGVAGPAARLWRNVYRKAIEAGAARAAELVRDHVYLFHRTVSIEGGGGAGGGLVELGRAVATAGQVTLRVPASGPLPTGYSGLVLAATGRNNSSTASQNADVYLFFNDDTDYSTYFYRYVQGTVTDTVVAGSSSASAALNLGLAPALNAAEPASVWGMSGAIPQHEATALPKAGQFLSTGLRTAAEAPFVRTTTGVYAPSPGEAITSVHLRCIITGWRVGATFLVYGHPDPA